MKLTNAMIDETGDEYIYVPSEVWNAFDIEAEGSYDTRPGKTRPLHETAAARTVMFGGVAPELADKLFPCWQQYEVEPDQWGQRRVNWGRYLVGRGIQLPEGWDNRAVTTMDGTT